MAAVIVMKILMGVIPLRSVRKAVEVMKACNFIDFYFDITTVAYVASLLSLNLDQLI